MFSIDLLIVSIYRPIVVIDLLIGMTDLVLIAKLME